MQMLQGSLYLYIFPVPLQIVFPGTPSIQGHFLSSLSLIGGPNRAATKLDCLFFLKKEQSFIHRWLGLEAIQRRNAGREMTAII